MSLVKFANRHLHRGQRLHWSRHNQDGLPYRGPFAPMYTGEEFEERVAKVGDPHAETFDLSAPEQKAQYLEVVDGIVNGWFQCTYVKRWENEANVHGFVRIEWVEYFLEDGHPTPWATPGTTELASGYQQFLLQGHQANGA